jgi:ABC-type multidrug transport system permease subunit
MISDIDDFRLKLYFLNRERSANAYNAVSYFIAKFFAELPFNMLPGLIFGSVIYWSAGLNPHRFGYFLLILWFTVVTSITLGMAVSAICPNAEVAASVGIPLVIIGVIFGGLYSKCAIAHDLIVTWRCLNCVHILFG